MLTFPEFSAGFYFCYMLAGFTDMIDGTIARKIASFAAIQEGFFIFSYSSAGGNEGISKNSV